MFHRLGRLTVSYPWTICAAWLALGAGLTLIAPHWDTRTQDDDVRFVPERFTSVRAYQILEKAFPQDVFASNLIFAVERENELLTAADLALVDRIIAELEKLRHEAPELKFGKVDSYQDPLIGWRLKSGDQQCTLIKIALGTPYLAVNTQTAVERAQERVHRIVEPLGEAAPHVYATGSAGIGCGITRACGDSLDKTTGATVLLVVVVLLLVYRAPLLALIPLVSIALSVWVACNLLALLTLLPGVHLVNISKIFAIVILYGAGTDYCLFLISRYREELVNGRERASAIATAVGGVGEALAASAGTVMVGLGLMALAEFAKVRYAGPAIALSLGVALLGSLTLTPALLQLLGGAAFWPRRPPSAPRLRVQRQLPRPKFNFWDWVSERVARRPLLVWSVSVAVLLPLVAIGLRVQSAYRATGELPPSSESLQGLAAIQRHFTAGEVGPVTILLMADKPWHDDDGLLQIDHLSRGFSRLPNVAEVRSLTQPLGVHLPILAVDSEGRGPVNWFLRTIQPAIAELQEKMITSGKPHYTAELGADASSSASASAATSDRVPAPVKKYVTRLDVVLKSDPFDPASADSVRLLQTWLHDELSRSPIVPGPVQAEFYGVTPNTMDLAEVTESDRHRVNALVLGAIFLILVVLVRKLWLAAYLLVTVLFSYFAALGATVLAGVFWTGQPLPYLDWRVPFFLFTILVAVGEDYNILLVNRALQERKRFGLIEGMRRALAKTGGAITSCGLIMAGTFSTLMLAGLGTLTQIGFALAFGVLVDTFLVRPFLVPAFTILVWRLRGHRDVEIPSPPATRLKRNAA